MTLCESIYLNVLAIAIVQLMCGKEYHDPVFWKEIEESPNRVREASTISNSGVGGTDHRDCHEPEKT